jgi:hypothetical protein
MHYDEMSKPPNLSLAANLTDRLWGWDEIVASMDAAEQPKKRGPYRKRAPEISN